MKDMYALDREACKLLGVPEYKFEWARMACTFSRWKTKPEDLELFQRVRKVALRLRYELPVQTDTCIDKK